MKKFTALMLVLMLALSAAGFAAAEEKPYAGQTLTISTFAFNAELLQKNIYDPFMEMTGCTIVADGASNAVRVTKLAEAAPGDYDVVIIGDMFVKQLMAEGKIDTLDCGKADQPGRPVRERQGSHGRRLRPRLHLQPPGHRL